MSRIDLPDDESALEVARRVTTETLRRHPWMAMWEADVNSDAALGATTALLTQDPNKAAALIPRMIRRSRGAVLDGIRDRAPVTRSEWGRGVRLEQLPAHRQGQASVEALEEALESSWHPVTDDDPATQLAAHDAVERLLGTLSDRDALIMRAYYLEGHIDTDIGRALGVSASLICKRRQLALQSLRDALKAAS